MREAAINAGLVQKTNITDVNWADRLHIITYVVQDLFEYFVISFAILILRVACIQRARSSGRALRASYEPPSTEAESELHDM